MGLVGCLLGIIGFGFGLPIGLLIGFLIFIYNEPADVKDPIIRPLHDLDTSSLLDILPEIPFWMKHPDYDRIDWFNRFISDMWPFLNKAISGIIRSTVEPLFSEYTGKLKIISVYFKSLSLGTIPPIIHGIKVVETNQSELVLEPVFRWAGNPDITLETNLLSLKIPLQLLDVQICAAPRITLKPLVPTFPCFARIAVSLMEKPQVDFGLKLLGVDIMAIPGLYQYIQEMIRKQIASFYLWPQSLEIPILDGSVGATKKPVGILHVKVVRALKLLKMDLLGSSDPYVKLSLSGERLPAKKTSIKMRNLNPVWNEDFKLAVNDPQSQVLQLHVYDWEKVGTHDKLGMQVVPLRLLTPHETQEFSLDLVKNTNPNDPQNKKQRGQLVLQLTFNPFKEDNERFSGPLDRYASNQSSVGRLPKHDGSICGSGLLSVLIQRAEDVEGKYHNNPYALIVFKGEKKKTKLIRKTRDPCWNEEFQFVLEEAPLKDMIHIEVKSKGTRFSLFRRKESLGNIDINLNDVVYNGRINEKYDLINSKNGLICIEIRWEVT
ncbi:hypothetical protein PTKIN_Ptkin13bG0262900 [Pterospermum kingtungense]